jgi:hypothetical protein
MELPAVYRIRVRGHLAPDWAARLEGMQITEVLEDDGEVTTLLVGRLIDQAALAGVLNALYELRLPVVEIDCLESD